MATIDLATLRRLVRERADHETLTPSTSEVEDSPELDGYINEGLAGFHDLMIELQRHEWCPTPVRTAKATMSASFTGYHLPKEALAVIKVRMTDGARWGDVDWFDNDERSLVKDVTYAGVFEAFRARVNGRTVEVYPARAGYELHVDYIPEFKPLELKTDSFECPQGWWMWPVWQAVIDILSKEDRDASQAERRLAFQDTRIRKLAGRRGGKLRVIDRWEGRRRPGHRMPGVGRMYNS